MLALQFRAYICLFMLVYQYAMAAQLLMFLCTMQDVAFRGRIAQSLNPLETGVGVVPQFPSAISIYVVPEVPRKPTVYFYHPAAAAAASSACFKPASSYVICHMIFRLCTIYHISAFIIFVVLRFGRCVRFPNSSSLCSFLPPRASFFAFQILSALHAFKCVLLIDGLILL